MKHVFILCIGLALSAASCKKKSYAPRYTAAYITGIDFRKCMCCGGPMITFSDTTEPYAAAYKIVRNNWEELGITDSTQFPVKVQILYKVDTASCDGKFITITALKK
ncbi:MAG: hypothetical protein ACOVQJ_10940 [Bacteroidia bacterium]|jgi:hypothetical protein